MAAAPTTIGTPSIREWRSGIRLSPNDIPNAFAILALLCEEADWDAVDRLAEAAQRAVTEGIATLPSLPLMLLSRSLVSEGIAPSNTAACDTLNREFHARGGRNFLFEHNASSMLPPFPQVGITIQPLTADHQVLKMKIAPIGAPKVFRGLELPVEQQLARDADLAMILESISINVPLETTDQGRKYRFDMAPFADALRRHGCQPGEYMHFGETTGRAFANRFTKWCDRQTSNISPTIQLTLDDGYALEFGIAGCEFSTYDTWEQTRTMHYALNGTTVFSGPIKKQFDSDKLDEPRIYVSIKGDAPHLPDREQFMLNLAPQLAASITSYHE